ncbi:MAG TPA: ribosome biogenesis GTPase Der, partial [Chlamydiales bacterium]|nr:ribosome biogenesis GTPase Der [Chlamydiales bacterium]
VQEEAEDEGIKVAFVGRPNVGKSTLLNYVLGEERTIASAIAGTTRDSIDAKIEIDGQLFTLIDTAGIRRKPKEKEVVEKFAAMRTETAIERADICVLLIDSEEGMSMQDKHIANAIEEAGKGCIIFFNKWDKVKGYRMEHCEKAIKDDASFLAHCPMLFASALTGRNTEKLFDTIKLVYEHLQKRITTGQLNKFVERTLQAYSPPMIKGKRLRIYYLTQVKTQPPHFVLFVNNHELMLETYRKYLLNAFRKEFGFSGCPVNFGLRRHAQREDISRYVASR